MAAVHFDRQYEWLMTISLKHKCFEVPSKMLICMNSHFLMQPSGLPEGAPEAVSPVRRTSLMSVNAHQDTELSNK